MTEIQTDWRCRSFIFFAGRTRNGSTCDGPPGAIRPGAPIARRLNREIPIPHCTTTKLGAAGEPGVVGIAVATMLALVIPCLGRKRLLNVD